MMVTVRYALLADQVMELAGLIHLLHNVTAADELALHIELRDSRPV
jgi:hypothetical protein